METSELQNIPELNKDSKPWGNITNPETHNEAKFRYLVYGIDPMATTIMGLAGSSIDPSTLNKEEGDQKINLSSYPERLNQRVSLSCSLVDQEHHETWGNAGLIVKAPKENVIITDSEDTGAIVMSKKHLMEQAKKRQLLTPEQLLQKTDPRTYNEVVVLANNEGKKVSLAGFFYKTTQDGRILDQVMYTKMKQHALRLDLPLVPITTLNPFAENKIIRGDNHFSVRYGGKTFILQGSAEGRFMSYSQSEASAFATPYEIEQVLNYLRTNNVGEKEIEQLRTEYVEADKRRQQPKVTYNEQGDVTYIQKRYGYGAAERLISVSQAGYTRHVNVSEEAIKYSIIRTNPGQPRSFDDIDPPASPKEVEQVVREAIDNAPDNEKGKLKQWWNNVRENVSKEWERNQNRYKFLKNFPKPRKKKPRAA